VPGSLAGNETVDEGSGVRIMQFVTPTAAAMGVSYAAPPHRRDTLAQARESGVLKRVRRTPLQPWVYLAGRIGGAVPIALGSVLIVLTVGDPCLGVEIAAEPSATASHQE
jgi:hypothetical protein